MTIRLLATLSILAAAASPQDTAKAGKVKVEVVGLHVNKAPYMGDMKLAPTLEPVPGTMISVLVLLDDGGVIRLDTEKSKLAKFVDDKGSNLLAAKPGKDSFSTDPFGSFPEITKDQKGLVVQLQAMAIPASGAKTLQVEATLNLTVGKDQEVVKQEKVAAEKDTEFKAGGVTFKITEAGKNTFGDDPMKINLESKEGEKVAKIRFFDSAGQEIPSNQVSRGRSGGGTEFTHTWDYTLKTTVPTVTVEVTLWKKVSVVDVPVKLAVSVGL